MQQAGKPSGQSFRYPESPDAEAGNTAQPTTLRAAFAR